MNSDPSRDLTTTEATFQRMKKRIEDLEEALRDCLALAASHMGGYAATYGLKDYEPRHKEIINRAQRLLGGRELP